LPATINIVNITLALRYYARAELVEARTSFDGGQDERFMLFHAYVNCITETMAGQHPLQNDSNALI
jgi:hypothetical protein